jgi:hypothetical protein
VSGPTKGIRIDAGFATTGTSVAAGAAGASVGCAGASVAAGASVGAGVAAGAQLASSIEAIIKKLITNTIFEVALNIFYLSSSKFLIYFVDLNAKLFSITSLLASPPYIKISYIIDLL